MSDIKHQTIEIVNGKVGPHLTEFGQSRRVSLVGMIRNEDGSPKEIVHITGIVDMRHESVHEPKETMMEPRNYDGSAI